MFAQHLRERFLCLFARDLRDRDFCVCLHETCERDFCVCLHKTCERDFGFRCLHETCEIEISVCCTRLSREISVFARLARCRRRATTHKTEAMDVQEPRQSTNLHWRRLLLAALCAGGESRMQSAFSDFLRRRLWRLDDIAMTIEKRLDREIHLR